MKQNLKNTSHGGKRKGAGRPKTMPETTVMRVPVELVDKVEKLITEFYRKRTGH